MPDDPSRRRFLGDAFALGASSLILPRARGASTEPAIDGDEGESSVAIVDPPSRVFVDHDGSGLREARRVSGGRFTSALGAVELAPEGGGVAVKVSCPSGPLTRVVLRWATTYSPMSLFLGDAWERGYGDLQWRFLQPERVMPWYFAAHDPASGRTVMYGVMTQPSALCFWTVDATGTSLWLDFRNGGSASRPGNREIAAATIVSMTTRPVTPLAALGRFCKVMSPSPRLASAPICGNNNWYYAYGRNFDADAMRRDATFLAEISSGHRNRPYCVIDAGWTPGSSAPGGPWTRGDVTKFPDMPGLAADMKRIGVRPGIWIRPTALTVVDDPKRLRRGPPTREEEKPLDLTLPENLEGIRADIARLREWGYELIKHDFSTYDAFGRWGFDMGAELTDGKWNWADQSLTNAEVLLRLYRTLREGADDGVLLGCNTIGHLAAGLFEIQRSGDDTSGRAWERTRRMGINTLAYRLPQNGTFFQTDPDCAAHTASTPWELDRQFLDLVAKSGTALFVSVDPRTVTAEQKAVYRDAMLLALSGGVRGGAEPLDWLHTTAPREWRIGGRRVTYQWEEAMGALPFRI